MSQARQPAIDALKVVGSQVIVLHHLAAYGPLSENLYLTAPGLMGWLYDYGRMAVQVFLVLGGYLAAQSLMTAMAGHAGVLFWTVWRRYLRLAPPFLVALLLSLGAAALARPWLTDDFVPGTPTLQQLLAHAMLLHDVMGMEALSAGVWYVAIDFQLHALLALLMWLGQRSHHVWPAMALVLLAMAVSLLLWNRDPNLDDWSIYFFGAYGLGVAARWTGQWNSRHCRGGWLMGIMLIGLLALALEYRARLALALGVALWLGLTTGRTIALGSHWLERGLQALGRSSYALFLIHFPVLLLGNALLQAMEWHSPGAGIATFTGVWAISVALGWAFERWVEAPMGRWVRR
jgi:peptidoglycan/LPS O-acetylase OafA/YrhL